MREESMGDAFTSGILSCLDTFLELERIPSKSHISECNCVCVCVSCVEGWSIALSGSLRPDGSDVSRCLFRLSSERTAISAVGNDCQVSEKDALSVRATSTVCPISLGARRSLVGAIWLTPRLSSPSRQLHTHITPIAAFNTFLPDPA